MRKVAPLSGILAAASRYWCGEGVEGEGGGGPAAGDAEGVARTIDISPDRFGQAAEHARDAIQAGQPDASGPGSDLCS